MSVPLTPERLAALHPLEVDAETGEPYLRLPAPHSHIVLTPPRLSDVPAAVENLNDMRIAANFSGPPYPYLDEHAISWITRCKQGCDDALANGGSPWFDTIPVRSIRDVSKSSIKDARLIGDCGISRDGYLEIMDEDERKRLEQANADKEAGDPSIVWVLGDWIDGAHTGQGIMTAVVRTLIEQWAVPRMNVHNIKVSALTGNRGSVRVFEKCEFVWKCDIPKVVKIAESKGGGWTGVHILEWTRPADAAIPK